MRLTLRTLLAYLDDILEPAQTREIGQKVDESNFAGTLIKRIREVMRQRRLTAPDVIGPNSGLDANTVAEYLDNTLPPDGVADVEKVCLESDVHLAEVAACHQILTLVLGEPVDVSADNRTHMYALGPMARNNSHNGSAAETSLEPPRESAAIPAGKPSAAAGPAATATQRDGSFADSIPDYLKPRPLWRRALPYIVVSVVAGVWLGLILFDENLFPGKRGRPGEQAGVGANGSDMPIEVAAADGPDGIVPDGLPPQLEPLPPDRVAVNDGNAAPRQVVPPANVPIDPTFAGNEPPLDGAAPVADPGDAAAENKPPAVAAVPAVPGAPALDPQKPAAEPAPPAAEGQPADPNAVAAVGEQPKPPVLRGENPPPIAPAGRAPTLVYNSKEGILLHYDAEAAGWYVMPHRSVVHPGERIVAPEPFDARLDVGNRLCRATLLGGTSARILGPNQAALFGFELDRGRLVLEGAAGDDVNAPAGGNLVIAVGVKGELWRVELLTAETRCGIEIVPRQPDQPEQDFGNETYLGALSVASGSVRFADGTGRVRVIDAPDSLSLTPADRAAAADKPNGLGLLPSVPSIPEWLDPDPKTVSSTFKRYANLFEKEFLNNKPMSHSVPPMVRDLKPRISELAVKCLALTGSYGPLVEALAQSLHEEARLAAIDGLRTWLPRDADNGKRLQDELQKHFRSEDAEAVYRLLWGYNEEDARNRFTSNQLIDWLEHDHVAVRELAFYHIKRLTGRDYGYRPLLPAPQRKATVVRWYDHLAKEGALLADP